MKLPFKAKISDLENLLLNFVSEVFIQQYIILPITFFFVYCKNSFFIKIINVLHRLFIKFSRSSFLFILSAKTYTFSPITKFSLIFFSFFTVFFFIVYCLIVYCLYIALCSFFFFFFQLMHVVDGSKSLVFNGFLFYFFWRKFVFFTW